MPYKTIMIALEGLPEESEIIHHAVRLKEAFGAILSVVHVNDPGAGKTHMMMDSLPVVREQDLREMFHSLGYTGLAENIDIQVMEDDSYAGAIASVTQEMDLLILGHHHKSQFMAALIDTTDEKLADLAGCPVLLVPLEI